MNTTLPANNPADIFSSWIALEVLSPQTFRKPEDLAGAYGSIAKLDEPLLPWEGEGEKTKPNYRLYYQIVLETIDFEKAISSLLKTYTDARIDPPVIKGEAVLAVIVVDDKGLLVEAPAVAVSSFGWAVPRALKGDLRKLGEWSNAEADLVTGLDSILRRTDDNDKPIPADRDILQTARNYLVGALDIPEEFITKNSFAIRTYEYATSPDAPDPILLNSFFVGDLMTAGALYKEGKLPANLQRYIGIRKAQDREDLLHNKEVFERSLSPSRMPPARWPGKNRHPLVVLQQAAVNLALSELNTGGILAVNGPPGTGKTTLLRDIVAGVVAGRAEAMCTFDNPADAFIDSGEKIAAGQTRLSLYKLDQKLKGFEIVIASSNNKAVENVSTELPGLHAIAEDAADLRYFTCLSDTFLQRKSWGLIAAVLGNAVNRRNFKKEFWWNEDVGLSTYLSAIVNGKQQLKEFKNPKTGAIEKRLPRIIIEENPPLDQAEALHRWQLARERFNVALERSRSALSQMEQLRQNVLKISDLETSRVALEKELAALRSRESEITSQARQDHGRRHPGFFAWLFRTRAFRAWKDENNKRKLAIAALEELHRAERSYDSVTGEYTKTEKEIKKAKAIIGPHIIDGEFFRLDHQQKHIVSPWCNEEIQKLRDDVFVAAMQVHKAFIDAAARPLRHNLGTLMMLFGGKTMPDEKKVDLIPDLWSSLFLVVPSISTTFASVERMLGSLPPESLGWLLIDEAGQALPQAAVGAIMRTKRAVVVGDPIQIEPVVVLPDTLTQNICRQFGIDPDTFNAPEASTQTLSDSATPYFAEFAGKMGSRFVGVPLLVHRRCENPMFGISNTIAYNDLMVQAKAPGNSPIRDLFGPSRWFDIQIQGQAKEKWCPEEGLLVMDMLKQLRTAGIRPDLYIITPFVIVADSLRKGIIDSGILQGWVDEPYKWPYERVGTVHTVQGREAEAVIFVLGAPLPQQAGARRWAGGSPNLPNVAVTRAKEVLYVIGNRQLWQEAGHFGDMSNRLP
ncbi:MAG TPA: ATP-binding protein [Puia sp.]|nr:ATP-binding protein [Puia sp.]